MRSKHFPARKPYRQPFWVKCSSQSRSPEQPKETNADDAGEHLECGQGFASTLALVKMARDNSYSRYSNY